MRFLCIVIFVLVSNSSLFGQLLASENFDAPAGVEIVGTLPGWAFTFNTSVPFLVDNSGLTFSGYSLSGIGRAAKVEAQASADDIELGFSSKSSGSIYVSFMMNVTSTAGAVYFTGLRQSSPSSVFSQLSVQDQSGTSYKFGLRGNSSGSATYSAGNYNYNTTYLVVIKHQFVSGTVNDISSLYVFTDNIPETEPGSPVLSVTPSGGTDAASLSSFILDQNGSAANCIIDGIRIATTWANAPLPVELTSFTALVTKYNVQLNWKTATEMMNHVFEVERSLDKSNWEKVGFVQGNGNSNSPKQYSFEERINGAGNLFYRLKQIDTDGTAEYSEPIEVLVAMPRMVELHQNYPNPFNPVTNISYSLPERTSVLLRVFDVSGQLVQTLVHGFQEAGVHTASFNGEALPSGMYFLNLQTPSGMETRKIQLIK